MGRGKVSCLRCVVEIIHSHLDGTNPSFLNFLPFTFYTYHTFLLDLFFSTQTQTHTHTKQVKVCLSYASLSSLVFYYFLRLSLYLGSSSHGVVLQGIHTQTHTQPVEKTKGVVYKGDSKRGGVAQQSSSSSCTSDDHTWGFPLHEVMLYTLKDISTFEVWCNLRYFFVYNLVLYTNKHLRYCGTLWVSTTLCMFASPD